MSETSCNIARIEHHPTGLILITDLPACDRGRIPCYFLTKVAFEVKVHDVIRVNQKSATIKTASGEHKLKLSRQNLLQP